MKRITNTHKRTHATNVCHSALRTGQWTLLVCANQSRHNKLNMEIRSNYKANRLSYMLHLLFVSHAPSTDRVSFRNQACMTWLVVIIWLVQWSATISQNLACATQEESKRNQSESDCRWKRNSNAWLLLRSQDVLIRFITELLKAFDAVLAQQHCSSNVGKSPLKSQPPPGIDPRER